MGSDAEERYPPYLAPLAYGWYRGSAAVGTRLLRGRMGRRVVNSLGTVSGAALARKRKLVTRHHRRLLGPTASDAAVQASVSGAFRSYARYWHEFMNLSRMVADGSLMRTMRTEGKRNLDASVAAGKGTIIVLPHVGGFDAGGAWLAQIGLPPVVVAEEVEPRSVYEWFVNLRTQIGMDVVPFSGDSLVRVAKALRENRVVCLLADRDISGDGLPVTFFGAETSMPAGPALLALRTGAKLIPGAVYFEGSTGHLVRLLEPISAKRSGDLKADLARITQEMASAFERLVAAAPEQWLVMVPFWDDDQ